jgi:hypothetical protein
MEVTEKEEFLRNDSAGDTSSLTVHVVEGLQYRFGSVKRSTSRRLRSCLKARVERLSTKANGNCWAILVVPRAGTAPNCNIPACNSV